MAAPEELGTNYELGIGSYTYAGYTVNSAEWEATGDVRKIKDEDGATDAVIIIDKGVIIRVEMIVKNGTDPTLLEKGDTITINLVNYRLESVTMRKVKGGEESIVNMTVEKEASMSYT